MIRKGMFATLVFMLASTLASAGGLEPGSASGTLEIGGYAEVLYQKYGDGPTGFSLGHFCLDIAGELSDDVLVAAEVEWTRAAPSCTGETTDAELVCAYIDYTIREPLVLRAGKFLVPFNVYNTRLYPADVAKLTYAPYVCLGVAPSKWAETGIQLHGEIDTGTVAGLDYAVYLVNGLEGEVTDNIQYIRNNDVEWNDSDKAIGARIGITTPVGFEAGLSGYKGAYTPDGEKDLTIIGLDACYTYEAFEVRGEYAKAEQEGHSPEDMDGFYLQGAYKFLDKYEAVLRYDEVSPWESSLDRFTLGGNYMITDDLTFRLSYQWVEDDDGYFAQLALRF